MMIRELATDEGRASGGFPSSQEAVYRFPQGLPGFEELKRYFRCGVEELWPLTLLVAPDEADVALPLLRPDVVLPAYSPVIPTAELQALEAERQGELEVFVVVSFEEGGSGVTANLRAPICFNVERRLGRQVVLPDGTYPLQYPLVRGLE
jgi:flagellar assembly factor FliW